MTGCGPCMPPAGPTRRRRRLARWWAAVFDLGLLPRRWVTLEVTGRRSGRTGGSRWGWPIRTVCITSFPCSANSATGSRTCGPRVARPSSQHRRLLLPPGRAGGRRAALDHQALPRAGTGRPAAHPGGSLRAAGRLRGRRAAPSRLPRCFRAAPTNPGTRPSAAAPGQGGARDDWPGRPAARRAVSPPLGAPDCHRRRRVADPDRADRRGGRPARSRRCLS